MKIVYLSNSRIPSEFANSVHVMKMCEALSINGHEIILFARQARFKVKDPYSFYGIAKCFHIKKFKIGSKKKRGSLKHLLYRTAFKLSVLKISPDLIYSRSSSVLNAVLNLKLPFVIELHHLPQNTNELKTILRSFKLERIIVISRALKSDIESNFPFVDKKKIIVAHDGATLPTLSELGPIHSDRFSVGYAGSLYPGRGIDIIASAAKRCPYAMFHIIGGHGYELEFWQNTLKDLSNIKLHGFIPHNDINNYLKVMNVVLAPYQKKVYTYGKLDTARWMSPLKIFEYMANGKAIVASNLEVIREILNHGNNALLVEPDNIEEWVSAIQKLYEDPNLCRRLGRQAFLDVKSHYTWAYRAKKVLKGLSLATGKP